MNGPRSTLPRWLELAADRATAGLDEREAAEFEACLRGLVSSELAEADELELAAARIHLAFRPADAEPPAGLAESLRIRAGRALPRARAATPWRTRPAAGWLAAAAVLLVALVAQLAPERAPVPARERMEALLASAPDLVRAEWTPGPDELGRGLSGSLVWSPGRQEGYMRFDALPPNDARVLQYQLWIFDARRAEPPVDGGVFDVGARGEIVVPIRARLEIFEPELFAVTAEAPGGVVVSRRERVVALAKPD
jgi:anti-sigma-K factor RskA